LLRLPLRSRIASQDPEVAMLTDTYSAVRSSIVAFAPKYPQLCGPQLGEPAHLSFIFGTGFIIDDSIIVTNQHVASAFTSMPKPPGDETDCPVVALFFTDTPGGFGICVLNVCNAGYITKYAHPAHYYGTGVPDVALVAVACTGLKKYAVSLDTEPARAGTEIATAGFPMGRHLLAPMGQFERFGPVLQRGIISAEAPFYGVAPHAVLVQREMECAWW
jgi:hypothetical protein